LASLSASGGVTDRRDRRGAVRRPANEAGLGARSSHNGDQVNLVQTSLSAEPRGKAVSPTNGRRQRPRRKPSLSAPPHRAVPDSRWGPRRSSLLGPDGEGGGLSHRGTRSRPRRLESATRDQSEDYKSEDDSADHTSETNWLRGPLFFEKLFSVEDSRVFLRHGRPSCPAVWTHLSIECDCVSTRPAPCEVHNGVHRFEVNSLGSGRTQGCMGHHRLVNRFLRSCGRKHNAQCESASTRPMAGSHHWIRGLLKMNIPP
jgi:hypothetical protein